MAADDDNNAMPPPPSVPPHPLGVAQGGGRSFPMQPCRQNGQTTAAMAFAFTPLPRVVVRPDMRASTTLSLTMVDDAPSAADMQLRTTNPMDGFESSEDEGREQGTTINSPDKEYDFKGRKSNDDSVARATIQSRGKRRR
jgi:hypothetical protein